MKIKFRPTRSPISLFYNKWRVIFLSTALVILAIAAILR